MNCNVGNIDRALRIGAGVVILGLGVYFHSWWGAIGIVPVLTGALKFCPAYTLLGMTTCKRQ